MVLAGVVYDPSISSYDYTLTRLNPDYTIDSTFNNGDWYRVSFGATASTGGPTNNPANALAADEASRILVAGTIAGPNNDFAVARYLPGTGAFDPEFCTFGRTVVDFGGNDQAYAIAFYGSAVAVLVGSSGNLIAAARLDADGHL